MNRNSKCRRRLRSSTLTEVLVVMIVAGIVLMSVMEGIGLLRRYTARIAGRITENSRFYDGYYRLEDLAVNADSITVRQACAVFWRGGTETAEVILQDSMLVCAYGHINDTLMYNVETLKVIHKPEENPADSLVVVLHAGEKSLTISFPVIPPNPITAIRIIEQNEKPYEYE